MPLQNRVTPEGEIIATPARGLMMGNRGGRLHRPDRTLSARRWTSRAWIACRLSFNNRQRRVMSPNSYTELFFLDEATALAAGHRPCFECRRRDFMEFATLWPGVDPSGERARAAEMDVVLQAERVGRDRRKVTFRARIDTLPDATFISQDNQPRLWLAGSLWHWQPAGYGPAHETDTSSVVDVLTPRSIVKVLAAGYRPLLHPSCLG